MWHVTTILTFSMQLKLLDNKPTEIKKEDSPMFYRRVGVYNFNFKINNSYKNFFTRAYIIYITLYARM